MRFFTFTTLLTLLVLSLLLLLVVLHQVVKEEEACIDRVNAKYSYLYAKSCNPNSSNACEVDTDLLLELDNWKASQLALCNR